MTKDNCQQKSTIIRIAAASFLVVVAAVLAANTARGDNIFSDNFTGSTLNPAWQVLPGEGSYSVGGGQLRYNNDGQVASTTGWYNPALTLALPFSGKNWEIDVKATYNLNYLFSNGNSTGAQGPEVLVKFNPGVITTSYGGPNYAGSDFAVIERDIDACTGCTPANYLGVQYGGVSNNNLINPADAGTPPPNNIGDGTYWYQIIRNGGTLTINVSYDGVNYITGISTPLTDPSGTYNELLLGGITYLPADSYTDYDYVKIMGPSATATPEPTTFFLFGTALLVLWAIWRRRQTLNENEGEVARTRF